MYNYSGKLLFTVSSHSAKTRAIDGENRILEQACECGWARKKYGGELSDRLISSRGRCFNINVAIKKLLYLQLVV